MHKSNQLMFASIKGIIILSFHSTPTENHQTNQILLRVISNNNTITTYKTFSIMVTPFKIVTFRPVETLFPMVTLPLDGRKPRPACINTWVTQSWVRIQKFSEEERYFFILI